MPDVSIYPGQSKIIQILNPNKTIYQIPTGSTVAGIARNVLMLSVADLTPTIQDANQGLIKVTLPDTTVVRQHCKRRVYYDLIFSLVSGVTNLTKFIPTAELDIQYSPTQDNGAAATPYAPGTGTTGGTGGVGAAATSTIVVLDQTWQGSNGKKYVQTVVSTAGGTPTFQLQEVT